MKKYNIAIASDHNGYLLKEKIIEHLKKSNFTVLDLGPNNNGPVDYPDYAKYVVDCISEEEVSSGILICGTGIGMSIAANRRSGIRAALCLDPFMTERARSHNDANIMILACLLTPEGLALQMVDQFLNTKFEGGRHSVRLSKIN